MANQLINCFWRTLWSGRYKAQWINPGTVEIISNTSVETDQSGHLRLIEPEYNEDIALFLKETGNK